jgi:hypothetical protein
MEWMEWTSQRLPSLDLWMEWIQRIQKRDSPSPKDQSPAIPEETEEA